MLTLHLIKDNNDRKEIGNGVIHHVRWHADAVEAKLTGTGQ